MRERERERRSSRRRRRSGNSVGGMIIGALALIIVIVFIITLRASGKTTADQAAPEVTDAPVETMPEETPEPEVTPEPSQTPNEYSVSVNCSVPVSGEEPVFDGTVTVDEEDVTPFYFYWLHASGNIDDEDDPDRLYHAAYACIEDLPFAVPDDYEYTDVKLSTITKFEDENTYLAVWLFELPGYSDTDSITLTVEPPCEDSYHEYAAGYTGYENVCYVAVRFYTAQHEHNWEGWYTIDATCTEAGALVMHCTICGASYSTPTAALGHAMGSWVSDGHYTTHTRVCSRCGYSETGSHNYVDTTEWATVTHTCSVCGDRCQTIY